MSKNGAAPAVPGTERAVWATLRQSRSTSGGPSSVACAVSATSRLRSSPSKPFITEMMVISAATPTQTPSMDTQDMNETKNP